MFKRIRPSDVGTVRTYVGKLSPSHSDDQNLSDETLAIVYDALVSHLGSRGVPKLEAAEFAKVAVRGLADSGRLLPPTLRESAVREAALRQVGNAIMNVRTAAAESFGRGAITTLPDRAPALWSDRLARLDGESPVEFLDRIWGPYIRAGILYQDDIKRLGDDKLVPNVRVYCHRRGLDASAVLPPPRHVRTERALAQAEPGSAEEQALKQRLRMRRIKKRLRDGNM